MPVTRSQASDTLQTQASAFPFIPPIQELPSGESELPPAQPQPSPPHIQGIDDHGTLSDQSIPHETSMPPEPPNPLMEMIDLLKQNFDTQNMGMLNLAQAVHGAIPRPKPNIPVKAPNEFTGRDALKLRPFLQSCQLNFAANPHNFQRDESKVYFAISYLEDVAAQWAATLSLEQSPSLSNWNLFEENFKKTFGDPGDEEAAIQELQNLEMASHHHAHIFIAQFKQLAYRTSWNDSALKHLFVSALPSRISNQFATTNMADTLEELYAQVIQMDNNYHNFKRKNPKHEQPKTSHSKPSNPPKPPEARQTPKPSTPHTSKQSTPKPHSNPPSTPSSSSIQPKTKPSGDLVGKLNSQGHLTDQERQKRLAEGACLYCGNKGHRFNDCPLKSKAKPFKARSSKTEKKKSPAQVSDAPLASGN